MFSPLLDSLLNRYGLNTLDFLPCTMEKFVFVTNVKWRIKLHRFIFFEEGYYSPVLFLHDPIKNEPIKIQFRFMMEEGFKGFQIEYKKGDHWKLYSSNINHCEDFEFTAHLTYNIYYSSKTLVDDLRVYLSSIHGETVTFDDKTISLQKCSNEILLAFIDEEQNEDFIIECQGKQFKIKKIILQARSPVFKAMLSTNYYTEGRENRMVIADFDADIVEKMIEFFETDFVKNTFGYEVDLYEISRKYLSQSFMDFTRLLFVGRLAIYNYDRFLGIAEKHNDKETKEVMKKRYLEILRHLP